MPVWGWVVLGVAVIVVVVLAGLLVVANRRTAALRRRFGPEYDRTVAATGDKRDAETNLEERQDRRSRTIHPGRSPRWLASATSAIGERCNHSSSMTLLERSGSRPATPVGYARAGLPCRRF